MPRISSSGTALTTSSLCYLGHEWGKLEDLLDTLRRGEIRVIPSQGRSLGNPLGRPVTGPFPGLHATKVQRRSESERRSSVEHDLGVVPGRLGDGAAED